MEEFYEVEPTLEHYWQSNILSKALNTLAIQILQSHSIGLS